MSNAAYQQTLRLAMAGVRGPLPPALISLVDDLAPPDAPAAQLLSLAALLGQAERCARPLPASSALLPSPAPAETLPCLGPERRQVLVHVLHGKANGLLAELVAWCAAHQVRLPDWALPDYLSLLTKHADFRSAKALMIAGARGPWLAAQNPDWAGLWVGHITPEDAHWQEGSLAQRSAWLAHARKTDADAARGALLAVWGSEPPDARAAFLAELRSGLSLADEPLLETARKDKRKEVRTVALELLALLPESAWAKAQLARIQSWLVVTPGGILRKPKLEVQLPEAWDKTWAFDGLTEKSTRVHEKVGDKANWLVDTLANVPLPQLLAAYALDAGEWFALIRKSDFGDALSLGSLESLKRAPSLATVLAAALAKQGRLDHLLGLAIQCPAAERQAQPRWPDLWLQKMPLVIAAQLADAQTREALPPWAHEQVIKAFAQHVQREEFHGWQFFNVIRGLVQGLAPPLLPQLYKLLQTLQDNPKFVIDLQTDDLLKLLQLRLQLHAP